MPAGYNSLKPFGVYVREAGNVGPSTWKAPVPNNNWVQLPSGFWMMTDGSGPYSRNIATGVAIPFLPFFG